MPTIRGCTVPTSSDNRPRVAAYSEFEQYEWLRDNLGPTLGLTYAAWHPMRYAGAAPRFRAWIADHVVFVKPNGAPCIVRPGVVRMLQDSPDFRESLRAARTDIPA